jgi:hypothetical protein
MSSQLPAYLQKLVDSKPQSADVASLASSTSSTPRISLRGRMFRFIEGGDEVSKTAGPIKVHLMGVEPGPGRFAKSWYEKAYSGTASDNTPPDCSSDDGVRPNPWSSKPQHRDCQSCPRNQFGSATSRAGKPSKACGDSKRLYITKEGEYAEGTIYLLQTPVSSLRALSTYGRSLADMGVDVWMPVTEIEMVDAEFPELDFKVSGFIEEAALEPIRIRSEKKEWAAGRLALQNAATGNQTPELPDHIARQVGISNPTPTTPLSAEVQAAAKQAESPTPPSDGDTPSNADVLGKW